MKAKLALALLLLIALLFLGGCIQNGNIMPSIKTCNSDANCEAGFACKQETLCTQSMPQKCFTAGYCEETVKIATAVCGNGICENEEADKEDCRCEIMAGTPCPKSCKFTIPGTCPQDCRNKNQVCGNKICEANENEQNCLQDCPSVAGTPCIAGQQFVEVGFGDWWTCTANPKEKGVLCKKSADAKSYGLPETSPSGWWCMIEVAPCTGPQCFGTFGDRSNNAASTIVYNCNYAEGCRLQRKGSCEELKQEIYKLENEIKACSTDSDCIFDQNFYGGGAYYCGIARNKNSDMEKFGESTREYNGSCFQDSPRAVADCDPNAFKAACINNKCEQVLKR